MFSARHTSSLSNHPSSCGGVKRRSRRWARAERCSTRSRSRCQLRAPIHTIFSMVFFFSVWFDYAATRLYGLHSVWMGTPNIQRSRIRKARRFIFFPVYESLFLQACIRITRAAPQKFRSQSDVAVVGVGWRREGGQNRANNSSKRIHRDIFCRAILLSLWKKSTTHDTR